LLTLSSTSSPPSTSPEPAAGHSGAPDRV
jgi:hypothetical protein